MHGLVLEDREDGFRAIEQRMPGPFEIRLRQHLHDAYIGFVHKGSHRVAIGPAAAFVRRRRA